MILPVTLSDGATIPHRAHPTDAGLDLTVTEAVKVRRGDVTLAPTGVSVAIPVDHVGLLFARSSLAVKHGVHLANGVGVIDSDYRGQIMVPLTTTGNITRIPAGTRIAQLVILPIATPTVQVVDSLNHTGRGEGGFGSTGVK